MAQITLNIPDAQLPRVIEALCARGLNMTDSLPPSGPNAKSVIVQMIKDCVVNYESTQARAQIPPVDTSTLIG